MPWTTIDTTTHAIAVHTTTSCSPPDSTPAVARASYIDPRVFDSFQEGRTIGPALAVLGDDEEATAIQGPAEEAVLDLLEGVRSSEYVERIP